MSEEVWPGMGERIGKRIKEMGHRSVEKFTKAFPDSDYSLSTVYKWIREEVAPSRANVLRLAADLKCEPSYLFFGFPTPLSRSKAEPIEVGALVENPLRVGRSSRLKEKHTKRGVSTRKDATLCQVTVRPLARCLLFPALAVACGAHRRAA